jgi:hypothetical protein
MRCAVIKIETNNVENVIIADASVDPAPPGHLLVNIPEDSHVAVGWSYDPITEQFTQPE